jgi:hypothetical protein
MPKRLFRHYQNRRIININVNVVTAGLLSVAIAKWPVALMAAAIGHDHKLLITVLAYVIDTAVDISLYFGLHWVANHWRPASVHGNGPRKPKPKHRRNFLADVGRVQAERLALVPVFAAVAMGLMYALQHVWAVRPSWAFVFGFIAAIFVTRVVHTVAGMWTGTFKDDHEHPDEEDPGTRSGPTAAAEPAPHPERVA